MNVTHLAIEADVKRWHLTHQHTDLKDRFQAEAALAEAKRMTAARNVDAHDELKKKYAELSKHCRHLESRLEIYATALNQLALELEAATGRDADAAKIRTLPRRRPPR
ncbi:hypothetical protein [Streptomyces sp. NRRL S-1022]|uniref:hypothetical protein n=1 Tax=Streptomyces sp. NRRL S-1022 TaxID=1463880 RepID=UPI00099CD494|nr:hypothetical protein [Streptomyces sp. NRRL S-1022]